MKRLSVTSCKIDVRLGKARMLIKVIVYSVPV